MTKYKGDDHMMGLLHDAGEKRTINEIKDLLRGVVAAPVDMGNPDAWLTLINTNNHDELKDQLKELKNFLRLEAQARQVEPSETVIADRLTAIRKEMKNMNLDAFFIPRTDEFQCEYVPERAERLMWSSGFTGSAGFGIVAKDKAAFFTDSRYTLQAKEEVSQKHFELYSISPDQGDTPTLLPTDWIKKNLKKGQTFGIHCWLHTAAEVKQIKKAVDQVGGKLVIINANPVDMAWKDQPPAPLSPVVPHPIQFAGKESKEKRADIARHMQEQDCDAVALTMPEDIAWLLNIRGNDVPNTPLPLSYALLHKDGSVDLFIDTRKVPKETSEWMGSDVRLQNIGYFKDALEDLGKNGSTVWVDPASAPVEVNQSIKNAGGTLFEKPSPVQLPKAIKNRTEAKGMVDAHIRDGVALTRLLAVLDSPGAAKLDELQAGKMVTKFRSENEHFRGLSFDPITGAAGNGAIVHYRSTPETNKPLKAGPVFLIDSGAQYLDGTTDVTRTVAVDTPTQEQRENFTLVLKGHIQVAMAEFVEGTTGAPMDDKARKALKDAGLNYGHGTGHGVGSYLSVHEGPCSISPNSKTPLEPGMVVSNEPGYYKTGEYGIRIENLVMVVDTGKKDKNGKRVFGFKTLTMAPIDRQLIEPSMLDDKELKWLNDYHADVRQNLMPLLEKKDPKAAAWLKKVTEPINKNPPQPKRANMFTL